jgi:hypothetical protein
MRRPKSCHRERGGVAAWRCAGMDVLRLGVLPLMSAHAWLTRDTYDTPLPFEMASLIASMAAVCQLQCAHTYTPAEGSSRDALDGQWAGVKAQSHANSNNAKAPLRLVRAPDWPDCQWEMSIGQRWQHEGLGRERGPGASTELPWLSQHAFAPAACVPSRPWRGTGAPHVFIFGFGRFAGHIDW